MSCEAVFSFFCSSSQTAEMTQQTLTEKSRYLEEHAIYKVLS